MCNKISEKDIIKAFEIIYSKPVDTERYFKFWIYGEDNYKDFCKLLHDEATKFLNASPKIIEKEINNIK